MEIKPKQSVLLDSVILIYYFDRHPVYERRVEDLLNELERKDCTIILSHLVFAEILVPYFRQKAYKKIKQIRQALSNAPHIHLQEVNLAISEKAAELRATMGMKTPDAIHLATALQAKADYLITNDKSFLKYQGMDLEIVLLDKSR